ncbi:uroporphyrinogen-III synthase [Methanonatronarchaeum sp. AMET6-2]|uniref:uroporphyrinogen-III synthase n=1 Tax=Methanonatronarchaeum sp. AMET6-2 TaxID=2933293 RepID=UPI00120566BF|nr:uroporphyrinogen-III synthase [Methanonatronarchaeum sp. AMET6-2]RZN60629.1 MAG: uroporphyrinogen-III synthase [Methanonatronarchaeia archaeon]UOY09666.1 uroporphyrinogen-III synthase [Methanonatronarchaeum sp. AMET6-2]
MKVYAITRPRTSIEKSKEILRENGFEPRATPTIQLYPEYNEEYKKLIKNIKDGDADILVLTSQNGVRFFFEGLKNKDEFLDATKNIEVYSIGPKTQKALEKNGVKSSIPSEYSSTGLVRELGREVEGKKVEIARSNHGSPELSQGLEKNGADVHDVPIYRVGMPRNKEKIKELIRDVLDGEIDILGFTSQMTVKNYMKIARQMDVEENLVNQMNSITISAIGGPTQEILRSYGVKNVVVPEEYLFKEMVREVKNLVDT